ncbi:MAG: hypothetical protein HRU20_20760 [Pseudomonadales bacterium]|nr:hypothetical protein [Pseudomonadales bacterium]
MKVQTIQVVIIKLLKPLAKLLLRSGISYQTCSEWLKQAFVEAAIDDFEQEKTTLTTSRIATITGLNRKEVKRLRELIDGEFSQEKKQLNRVQRVINAWNSLPDYRDKNGQTLAIKFDGDKPNFSHLVKQASGDITARTVYEELERIDAITIDAQGKIQLCTDGFVAPPGSKEQWLLAGQACYDLLNTLNHNISDSNEPALYQRFVSYSTIPEADYPAFQAFSRERSEATLIELNQWLKEKAVKKAETKKIKTLRTGVGIYHFKE